ncbi:hypothetical protein F5X68DRAFT_174976 [Plectosphaerella plurivora]|uniref:DNA replication complex GINS protein PSF2 n=1 Tax=Plectosphaerella plurivora TaxID=936078 RepID=A0A9P9A700_9PEZI|nr:hypothetical protein F5X68DRAFT_174976 [Plectosphaerella plurivora]
MALPLPPGLVPSEVAFLCEMELVTVVPRQRLDSIELLSGATPPLRPPYRSNIPLWLALLLKKQRRANIVAPAWLYPDSLRDIIHQEQHVHPEAFSPPPPPPVRADALGNARRATGAAAKFSPPFLPSCTAQAPSSALPYHWFELAELLLAHAADDIPSFSEVRSLMRDLQEIRAAKMRKSTAALDDGVGGVMQLRGVGAMELAESRGFIIGVIEGVRRIGASSEANRREEEEGRNDNDDDDDMDDDMFG